MATSFVSIWRVFLCVIVFSKNAVLGQQQPDDGVLGSVALNNFPLIDGHNDLPFNLYQIVENKLGLFKFDKNLSDDSVWGTKKCDSCHTDLPRLKTGKLGAQFWVAYVKCSSQHKDAVSKTLDQIDVIKRLIEKYPDDLTFVTSSDGILEAFKGGKIASLIGVEGGHSIDNKLSILRSLYELGVRYMTLTHFCSTPWADSSMEDSIPDNPRLKNLTNFGKRVVLEMNRLGMMVDLSHVSHGVMSATLDITKAPVIFSHSSAFGVHPHHRNVRDDILKRIKKNGGVVMVNFYTGFLGTGNVTIKTVVDHVNHIVDITGVDHVGIGSDFDGVTSVPEGLNDVAHYPDLFDLLKKLNSTRWTIENLEKLAGRNLLRVFKEVENIRDSLSMERPDETLIDLSELVEFSSVLEQCTTKTK